MFFKEQKLKFSYGYSIWFPTYTQFPTFSPKFQLFYENWNSADLTQTSTLKTHTCMYLGFYKPSPDLNIKKIIIWV